MLISVRLRLINVEAPRCECEVSLHQCGRRETSVFPQTTSPSPKGAALILFGFFFFFFLFSTLRTSGVCFSSLLAWCNSGCSQRYAFMSFILELFFFFFPIPIVSTPIWGIESAEIRSADQKTSSLRIHTTPEWETWFQFSCILAWNAVISCQQAAIQPNTLQQVCAFRLVHVVFERRFKWYLGILTDNHL